MASPQLRPRAIPVPRGAAKTTVRATGKAAREPFKPARAPTQFYFRTEPDRATVRWRGIALLASLAIVVIGAIAALAYLLGIVAAAIAAAAVGALFGFGNWILDHTIEL